MVSWPMGTAETRVHSRAQTNAHGETKRTTCGQHLQCCSLRGPMNQVVQASDQGPTKVNLVAYLYKMRKIKSAKARDSWSSNEATNIE